MDCPPTPVPMVIHARGPLVSTSASARPRETLELWVYWLERLNTRSQTPFVLLRTSFRSELNRSM